jgi:hypothetical protein
MTRPYGFHLLRDDDEWCAVGPDFIPAGLGETKEEAVEALQTELRKLGWPEGSIPALGQFTVHDCFFSDEDSTMPLSTVRTSSRRG